MSLIQLTLICCNNSDQNKNYLHLTGTKYTYTDVETTSVGYTQSLSTQPSARPSKHSKLFSVGKFHTVRCIIFKGTTNTLPPSPLPKASPMHFKMHRNIMKPRLQYLLFHFFPQLLHYIQPGFLVVFCFCFFCFSCKHCRKVKTVDRPHLTFLFLWNQHIFWETWNFRPSMCFLRR